MRLRPLLVAALAAVALAGCGAPAAVPAAPTATTTSAVSVAARTPDVPVTIEIPALKASDEVVSVGLARDGSMEVPPVDRSGWYDLGPRPGDNGSAVIVGHVNYAGVPGFLGGIGRLHTDDQVIMSDASGTVRVFAVYAVVEIPKAQYILKIKPLVFGHTDGPELRLVTCSGPVVDHQYLDNTVVSARLVQP